MVDPDRWSRTATVGDVPRIRDFVADACVRHGASGDAAFRLALAAGEICANVLLHGYGGVPGPLDLRIRVVGDTLRLVVRDEATPFDPTDVEVGPGGEPSVERGPGGLGLLLVHRLVDELAHRRHGAGNELVATLRTTG